MTGPECLRLERVSAGKGLAPFPGNPNHASEKWRLMHEEIDVNGALGTRRFVTSEADNIHGDMHVHNQ